MAGFLRKKSKQEPVPKVAPAPVTYSKPSDPPPLFARFATTAQVSTSPTNSRIVSGPIPLVHGNGRKESFSAGSGRAGAGNNQTSAREADMGRRPKVHDQAQLSQASINFYAPSNAASVTGQYKPRPVSVDKPLPPPVNAPVSPPPNRRASAMAQRAPGPPPTFQQPTQGVRSRASVDFEHKPLPRAGSVQAHIWQAEVKSPPPNPKATMTTPPPQPQQRSQPPPTQQQPQPSVPQRSQPPLPPPQSYPRDNGNVRSSNRMSMGGAQQMRTPMSDRVDLPPEFALFQQFSEAMPTSRPPSIAPPNGTLKTNEHAPATSSSSGPRRSSIYASDAAARNALALKPQPSVPQFVPVPQRTAAASPDLSLPPPPPPHDMGVSASRMLMTEVLPAPSPSPYKDFHHQPHGLSTPNGRGNTTYTNGTGTDVHHHLQTYPTPPTPASMTSGSVLPSLPPGAGLPSSDLYPAAIRNAAPASFQQPQPHPQSRRQSVGQLQSSPSHTALRKAPSVQGPGIVKGKPKIFAAMAVEAQEVAPIPRISQTPPPPPKYPQDTRVPHQTLPLLPPFDLKTPRVRQEPLPTSFPEPDQRRMSVVGKSSSSGSPPKPTHPIQPPSMSRPLPHPVFEEPLLGLSAPGAKDNVPHRPRKLSKPRHHDVPRPSSSHGSQHRPATASSAELLDTPPEPVVDKLDEDTIRKAGLPLDDDPFAKPEGVVLLNPVPPPTTTENEAQPSVAIEAADDEGDFVPYDGPAPAATPEAAPAVPLTPESPPEKRSSKKSKKGHKSSKSKSQKEPTPAPFFPMFPDAPPREPMTFTQFVATPELLALLLSYLSFYEWCIMSAVSREIRIILVRTPALKEVVLEQYLRTVGYQRWQWEDQEPLSLSLQDLSDYMRGVSTPTHEYSRVAAMHIHSLSVHPNHRDPSLIETVRNLTSSTRAYNRVLLRLRAQAEKEASVYAANSSPGPSSPPSASSSAQRVNNSHGMYQMPGRGFSSSRLSSRAPSPTQSMFAGPGQPPMPSPGSQTPGITFRSPLFRLRRAPLLRVFVPSPEGDWLSDKSVLECESECRKSGIQHLMRSGDVVWDVAVGDEGNIGRLVWDGSYLIDLDYTYSTIGDLPKYLSTLAFPPSYFHRVIRTGASTANPIAHIDISPWGEEIAMNLQLLQDRVRTETPQGAYHNVVRWVHRSSFTIKPPRQGRYAPSTKGGSSSGARIPIPNTNLFVDSGWYGTIVVETEGTNEALADLQNRCGPGAFPPRARGVTGEPTKPQMENKLVYRILREKSRPGEIWIRAVSFKERMM